MDYKSKRSVAIMKFRTQGLRGQPAGKEPVRYRRGEKYGDFLLEI